MSRSTFVPSAATYAAAVNDDERQDPTDFYRHYGFSVSAAGINQHFSGLVGERLNPGRPRDSGAAHD